VQTPTDKNLISIGKFLNPSIFSPLKTVKWLFLDKNKPWRYNCSENVLKNKNQEILEKINRKQTVLQYI